MRTENRPNCVSDKLAAIFSYCFLLLVLLEFMNTCGNKAIYRKRAKVIFNNSEQKISKKYRIQYNIEGPRLDTISILLHFRFPVKNIQIQHSPENPGKNETFRVYQNYILLNLFTKSSYEMKNYLFMTFFYYFYNR